MADPIDAVALRAALNRDLGADGITVGIRELTPTDTWILAWRVDGSAEVRVLHVALDVADPEFVRAVVEIIRRELQEYP